MNRIPGKKSMLTLLILFVHTLLQAQDGNPFKGFRFMPLPRNVIPIGALWNTAAGPVGDAVPETQLKTAGSYLNLDLYLSKDQKAELETGILKYFKAGGKYKNLSNVTVSLGRLDIVTLNSLDILKANVGNEVLYEAIKAAEISVTVDKDKSVDAQLELMQLFKTANLTTDYASDRKVKIAAKGINLFVAYRVIRIGAGKPAATRLKFRNQGHSSSTAVTLSSNYEANTEDFTVQICPCSIQTCMKNTAAEGLETYQRFNRCAATTGFDLTVILKKKMNMTTGKPDEYRYVIKSPDGGAIHNYNQPIYNKTTSQGLEVSYLNFERLVYEAIPNTYLVHMLSDKKNRNVSLVTTSFTFTSITPQSVAGW